MSNSRAENTPHAPFAAAQRARPAERPADAEASADPDEGAGCAADESLPERYAQLRASGLACSRW